MGPSCTAFQREGIPCGKDHPLGGLTAGKSLTEPLPQNNSLTLAASGNYNYAFSFVANSTLSTDLSLPIGKPVSCSVHITCLSEPVPRGEQARLKAPVLGAVAPAAAEAHTRLKLQTPPLARCFGLGGLKHRRPRRFLASEASKGQVPALQSPPEWFPK